MEKVICYVVGVAKGNPGPAAVGVRAVGGDGAVMFEKAQSIGNASVDFAGFNAVTLTLQLLSEQYRATARDTKFEIKLDNEVVKKQLNDESSITHPGLVPMFVEIHNLRVTSFPHLAFTLISEAENQDAHRLVNEVLDAE
jgi:ribonuclease HI